MRKAEITRKTGETDISLKLNLDSYSKGEINTGCGFLNHMLELFARHGRFSLDVICKGDTDVDYHHTTEDIAIVLGKAFSEALGDCRGITRYGSMLLPMDETLMLAAVDISGRGNFFGMLDIKTQKVGDFDTELAEEFFDAFARNAGVTLHIRQLAGENSHHIIEAAFKAAARAMRIAVNINPEEKDEIPSTKGVL